MDRGPGRDVSWRNRVGAIPEPRTALAAHLGEESLQQDLRDWCKRLEEETPEAQARIALVAAEWVGHLTWAEGNPAVIPAECHITEEDRGLYDAALRAVSAWVMQPDPSRAQRAARAADAICHSGRSSERLLVARVAAVIAASGTAKPAIEGERNVTASVLGAQRIFGQDPRPIIRETVVPWALGSRQICAPACVLRGRFTQATEQFEAVQRRYAEDPRWSPVSWSRLLFVERHELERHDPPDSSQRWRLSQARLRSPKEFEDRFVEILDEARCDWINLCAHGVWNDALVVVVETGDNGGTDLYPIEWIHIVSRGPNVRTGFDLGAHTEISP